MHYSLIWWRPSMGGFHGFMCLGGVMCWCSSEVTQKGYVLNVSERWIRQHCKVFLKTLFFCYLDSWLFKNSTLFLSIRWNCLILPAFPSIEAPRVSGTVSVLPCKLCSAETKLEDETPAFKGNTGHSWSVVIIPPCVSLLWGASQNWLKTKALEASPPLHYLCFILH